MRLAGKSPVPLVYRAFPYAESRLDFTVESADRVQSVRPTCAPEHEIRKAVGPSTPEQRSATDRADTVPVKGGAADRERPHPSIDLGHPLTGCEPRARVEQQDPQSTGSDSLGGDGAGRTCTNDDSVPDPGHGYSRAKEMPPRLAR